MSWIKQIWDFFPVIQKILRILRWFTWISRAEIQIYESLFMLLLWLTFFKKDYVVGIYIQFIYRNCLPVLQKIPNHVMEHIKFKPTLVNLLPHL